MHFWLPYAFSIKNNGVGTVWRKYNAETGLKPTADFNPVAVI